MINHKMPLNRFLQVSTFTFQYSSMLKNCSISHAKYNLYYDILHQYKFSISWVQTIYHIVKHITISCMAMCVLFVILLYRYFSRTISRTNPFFRTHFQDDVISALEKRYCNHHFECHGCQQKLDLKKKFVEFDMKPLCTKCFEKFPSELKKRIKKNNSKKF